MMGKEGEEQRMADVSGRTRSALLYDGPAGVIRSLVDGIALRSGKPRHVYLYNLLTRNWSKRVDHFH